MAGILSFGGVYLDINATNFPIPSDVNKLINTETVGSGYEMVVGGSAVNVARFCKKLGMSSFFTGKVGQDKTAEILKELFTDEGITPLLVSESGKQTNLNTNLVGKNEESLMLSFGNANASLQPTDVLQSIKNSINAIDYVYMGGVFKLKTILPEVEHIASFVQQSHKKVVVDHGRIINTVVEREKEIVRQIALQCDIYLPSKDEFLELWNVKTIAEGLLLLRSKNKKQIVVVKDAENGAWTLISEKVVQFPAFSVSTINTVGAGDAFNAGLITALSENKPLEKAINFANTVAALKISQSGFPTTQEIVRLLQS